ncbi:AAA family ATPase [Nitrospira sp. T9]|uniref:AAA family ATPase n=1 Tax=unclassified Nitrospira TaxID=2652172 RepID=UPI003F9AF856
MGISLSEATTLLLTGKTLTWEKYKVHKAGSITLDKPEQRRLLEFLLSCNSADVAQESENLFAGIVNTWENEGHDPATRKVHTSAPTNSQSWRLDRIEAFGFGGLTVCGGKKFDLFVGGSNWCLEGQNGSGKTSLVSAILWALTGKRIREHEGPVDERGEREPVENDEGKSIGKWPPLAAYPPTVGELGHSAEVWVRLTFKAKDGEIATAYRRMVSPPNGYAQMEEQIDDRLQTASRPAEIGVLMPARLAKIGFGKSSQSLFEAIKQLTGLDQLSDIAEGCSVLGAGNRKFMKYAKEQGIENHAQRFRDSITTAKQLAEEFQFELPDPIALGIKNMDTTLKAAAKNASESAGKILTTLKSEISTTIDTATTEGRASVKNAVTTVRGLVTQDARSIPLFQTWKTLTDAASDESFAKLPVVLETAKADLAKGLEWHERQMRDGKLRLKALAAQSFVLEKDKDSDCPLCTSPLDNEQKRSLAAELQDLKINAVAAERKVADVCRSIQETVTATVPVAIRNSRTTIDALNPVEGYSAAMTEMFVTEKRFSNVLTGLAASAKTMIETHAKELPHFSYVAYTPTDGELDVVTKLRREIHALERLIMLVDWWKTNHPLFADAWCNLIGKKLEDGTFPLESVEGKLVVLEQALEHARPLDDFSKHLSSAATASTTWAKIDTVQNTREKIAKSLAPLKDLKLLVAAETASSIARLSSTINTICERIRLKERLVYEEATIGRKEVTVTGSFSPGMRIDAALVANTSWLRAILWSFVFALREETIQALGFNPFPLVVLDDPQVMFDPRNKRKWAEELARCANMPITEMMGSQLIVTTHERNFYQMLIEHEKLFAQEGLIGGVNKISGVATVANGGELQRSYDEAKATNDDAKAREYIRKVRIYCEDLIKFMLRSVSNEITDLTLNKLKEELKKLRRDHVAPYDRKAFEELINALNESIKAIQYLNETHHKEDGTYSIAEAEVVKQYWEKTLLDKIHTAFGVFDTFELFTGEPRTFPWAKNVIEFPDGHKSKVKSAEMQQTGVAAAAKTNGRAGDGVLTVEEWEAGEKVVLPNHELFQLAAGTLDPVAGIGDLIIVSNYAKTNPLDLVVVASGSTLLARRLNRPDNHSEIVVLTGQAVDPSTLPQPVIVQPDNQFRKIVGTLFVAHLLPVPPSDPDREFIALPNTGIIEQTLKGARLFKVQGRSAEPIALEGQYLITRGKVIKTDAIASLDGRLVVGIDEDGARYFKRLRCHKKLVVLESLNPDGSTAAEVLSLDGSHALPKITEALEVVGVLFELPNAKDATVLS